MLGAGCGLCEPRYDAAPTDLLQVLTIGEKRRRIPQITLGSVPGCAQFFAYSCQVVATDGLREQRPKDRKRVCGKALLVTE